jgi:hypothetical protein
MQRDMALGHAHGQGGSLVKSIGQSKLTWGWRPTANLPPIAEHENHETTLVVWLHTRLDRLRKCRAANAWKARKRLSTILFKAARVLVNVFDFLQFSGSAACPDDHRMTEQ